MNQIKPRSISSSDLYEKKRNGMVRHLSFVIMAVAMFYTLLDFIFETNVPSVLLIGTFLAGLGAYLLVHFKHYTMAKVLGLLIIDLVVFAAATSESEHTNIFLFFGSTGLTSLVVFGYEDKWKAFVFVLLSALLYIFTNFTDFAFLPYRNFTERQVQMIFIINVSVFTYVSAYIIFIFLKLNFDSEQMLIESNKAAVKQNDELIKINAELDRFMYSTSHDMRAPLSSLTGLIKLSEMTADVSEIKDYVRMMKGSINNLEKFTLSITDHYRNSRTEVQLEKIALKPVIDEIIGDLSFAGGVDIKFIYNISDDDYLLTDGARLRVILNNIISNSIKYRNSKLNGSTVSIHYAKNGTKHCIKIKDNGIGIGGIHLERIFDMFYRASETSRGSGLGLYIVRETVEKLKGSISVSSVLGEGTTFHLELPASEGVS